MENTFIYGVEYQSPQNSFQMQPNFECSFSPQISLPLYVHKYVNRNVLSHRNSHIVPVYSEL